MSSSAPGPAGARASGPAYRPDIDGLRAIAVLLVVVFHFRLVPGVASGFMGVDVFFVISGFLITTIVQRQIEAGTFRLRAFWIARIRRLAPALVATTVLTLIAGWIWLLPGDFAKLAQQTLAAQLYVANIFYWRNVNYFGLQAHDVFLLHTWSLAVEEQFYLFFPLLMLAIAKWAKGRTAIVLAVLTIVSFALDLAFVDAKPQATFYLMPTRAWELGVGGLLALARARATPQHRLGAELSGAAGVLCLVVAVLTYRLDVAFPGFFTLWPVAGATLLLLSGSLGPSVVSRGLGMHVPVYIGRISYPLYLVHWPINVFAAAALEAGYGWGWRLAMLLLSIASAMAIFHAIEAPVRRWLDRVATVLTLRAYSGALVGIVAVCGAALATGGAAFRYPAEVARLDAASRDAPPLLERCEYRGNAPLRTEALCRLGATDVGPTWLFYGDSHAWAASGALDLWLKRSGKSAAFIFMHACPPLQGVWLAPNDRACFAFNSAVLAYLREQPNLADVFLISTWLQAKEGILMAQPASPLGVDGSVALFDRQLGATVAALHAMGKRVHVWEPVPGARLAVPRAMALAALDARPLAIDFTRDEYFARNAYFFAPLARARADIADTFAPARELCASGQCVTQIGGAPVYFDNGHLAYSLRSFWADALARQMPLAPAAPVNREQR